MLTYDYIEKLIAKVRIAYPFNYKNFTDQDFELLIELWYEDLSGYPETVVSEAFKRARQSNKISVTTADIIEQIEKIQSAFEPSEQELWREFVLVLSRAQRYIDRLYYTAVEENGNTQAKMQGRAKRAYNSLA